MAEEKKYIRMTGNERIQHFFLLSSFIVLVITGFWLKFPEAWWVKWIVFLIGEHAFEARGVIHRVASVVLVIASVYHLIYIAFSKNGRKLIIDFLPVKKDVTDFKDSMLYLTGKKEEKPRFGRFSYIEKMEYWAVVWGTVIMGLTGVLLWFKDFFFKYVSNEVLDIATTIHYYEAILASLAILVWHFYFVFLNPDVYPMNKAWFSGLMTKEEMEHEHPLQLEELEEMEEIEALEEMKEPEKSEESEKIENKSETEKSENK